MERQIRPTGDGDGNFGIYRRWMRHFFREGAARAEG